VIKYIVFICLNRGYYCRTQEEILVSTEIGFDISLVLKKSCLRKLATSPRKLLYYLAATPSRIDADKSRTVDKQLVTDLRKTSFQKNVPTRLKQLRINSWRKQIRSETMECYKPKELRLHDNAHHHSKAKTTWRAATNSFLRLASAALINAWGMRETRPEEILGRIKPCCLTNANYLYNVVGRSHP